MDHCETHDSLGRRRQPTQSRGLRPLFPPLDPTQRSESVRIAMTERAWQALDGHVTQSHAPTKPRAIGDLLERALGTANTIDWQEFQIRKEKQLLEKTA